MASISERRKKNREKSSSPPDKIPGKNMAVLRERNVAYNPAIGARMIKNYLLKYYPELIGKADETLPEVFKSQEYSAGINYFDGMKAEFKTITGKKWDENIDTYLAFANLKALEHISKILSK